MNICGMEHFVVDEWAKAEKTKFVIYDRDAANVAILGKIIISITYLE